VQNLDKKEFAMADKISPVALKNMTIAGGFWGLRAETNRTVTLAIEYDQLKKTGRIDAFQLDGEGAPPTKRHRFWDSDVAKWLEAAVAYFEATGKRKLLDVLYRYADHIDQVFGPNEGQKRGAGLLYVRGDGRRA
jgi:DUF1680 family protein